MMEQRNEEEFSETRKRGRPPIMDDTMEQILREEFPTLASRRALCERQYMLHAVNALGDAPEFAWLISGDVRRKSILSELGRLRDPEHIRQVAARLCETKPTARRAIAFIRHERLGERPVDADRLTTALARGID